MKTPAIHGRKPERTSAGGVATGCQTPGFMCPDGSICPRGRVVTARASLCCFRSCRASPAAVQRLVTTNLTTTRITPGQKMEAGQTMLAL